MGREFKTTADMICGTSITVLLYGLRNHCKSPELANHLNRAPAHRERSMKETVQKSVKKDKPRPYPVINVLECKACGRCIEACPQKALELSNDFNDRGYRYVKYVSDTCIGCRDCFYTCPEPGAIEIRLRGGSND